VLHPFHDMLEVPSVETFWAPNQGIIEALSSVPLFYVRVRLFEVFGVAIVDGDGEKANAAFRQHFHAVKAVPHLIARIFGVYVVSLHSWLSFGLVIVDSFRDG
jgi:hypothetical protein